MLKFVVMERGGIEYMIKTDDMPPRSKRISFDSANSSTVIRDKIIKEEPYEDMVTPRVFEYINRYGLYDGSSPGYFTRLDIKILRPRLILDKKNELSVEISHRFNFLRPEDPNLIIPIGGDGQMLHSIKELWQDRIPFLGVNTGHVGYLLNNPKHVLNQLDSLQKLRVYQLPALLVKLEYKNGQVEEEYAFNDVGLFRERGCQWGHSQTSWLRVLVDNEVKIDKLVGDGILASTPAGSTAYALAMGADPLSLGSAGYLLVGNNSLVEIAEEGEIKRVPWKSAYIRADQEVKVESLDDSKRKIYAEVDGLVYENVVSMTVRPSNVVSVELAFVAESDLDSKRFSDQFP